MPAKKKVVKKATKKTVKKVAKKAVKKAAKKATPKKKAPAKKTAKKKAPAKRAAVKKKAAKKATPKKTPAKKVAAPAKATKKAAPKAKKKKAKYPVSFLRKQKSRLLELRDELVTAIYGQKQNAMEVAADSDTSGSGEHTGDAGTDAYDRDFALNLLAQEQDSLDEIEKALERIEDGSYGICEMSGEQIPQMRLEFIPFARLTIECQQKWESENGNQRFKPAETVGYNSW